jgi:hypothetical protein
MRSNTGRTADELRRQKEQGIGRFIERYLETMEDGHLDAVLVVARSSRSPVACALMASAADLKARGLEARIILGGDEPEGIADTDLFDGLAREIRIIRDARLLDSHEQLVLGEQAVWYGDSMRRDPLQRDAHASFAEHDVTSARLARSMFERLWQLTLPICCPPGAGAPSSYYRSLSA